MIEIKLKKGQTHTAQKKANYEESSLAFGRSGIETLFSTTSLVELMIQVTVELVGDNIPKDYISVAKNMEISHLRPTLQGSTVTAKAELSKIDGNILYFDIVCYDEQGETAKGKQERHIVNKEGLINKAHQLSENIN